MREIRFRALYIDEGGMMDVISINFLSKMIILRSYDSTDFTVLGEVELMQYTGLKDKNGVEIYEGDVVDMVSMFPGGVTLRGEVRMMEGSFTLVDARQGFATHLFNELSTIEVIGNLYEHPELLEGE